MGSSHCGFGAWTVWGQAVGREEPGIDDGEIGGDDGEEEEDEADDLRDVEGVVSLENESENDQATMVKQMMMRATVFAQGL